MSTKEGWNEIPYISEASQMLCSLVLYLNTGATMSPNLDISTMLCPTTSYHSILVPHLLT